MRQLKPDRCGCDVTVVGRPPMVADSVLRSIQFYPTGCRYSCFSRLKEVRWELFLLLRPALLRWRAALAAPRARCAAQLVQRQEIRLPLASCTH
ncbi:hypothetical protein Y032_0184g1003 [Ancylostoma ceylanicum]|uniref:Uncharacterized protein n=1 Tax=Ancylostoma ceylanicum TaxID=53326 RepID=A0A016SSB6_9BILA|nr:hypothetical protein Y032_0184g1003 [Ancylostoma ceylanicum]